MSAGDQVRDHSSVNDIARGVIAAALQPLDNTTSARIFNLRTGDTRPLREMVCSVIDELPLHIDLRLGARPYSSQIQHARENNSDGIRRRASGMRSWSWRELRFRR